MTLREVIGLVCRCAQPSRPGRGRHGTPLRWVIVLAMAWLAACDLVPTRPDVVFTLYRDRMKAGNLEQARGMLTDHSKRLAIELEVTYKLDQPPEDLSLLNSLDPVSAPSAAKSTDTEASLQLRTLKGGMASVRLIRNDSKSPWRVDLEGELIAFQSFMEAQKALEMIREQAGEYATTWKAFNDRLKRIKLIEAEPPPAPKLQPPPRPPKEKPKPQKKQTNPRER